MAPFISTLLRKAHHHASPCSGPRSKGEKGFTPPSSSKSTCKVGLASQFRVGRSAKAGTCNRSTSLPKEEQSASICSADQCSYPVSEYRFLLGSALRKQVDAKGDLDTSSTSVLPTESPAWFESLERISEEKNLRKVEDLTASTLSGFSIESSDWLKTLNHDEEKVLEELQKKVSQGYKDINLEEKKVEALEKQMKLETFQRTKPQAHYGDCFAIVYCAIFRFRSMVSRA